MDQVAHQHHHELSPTAGASTHAGHDRHAGHSVAMFRDKFWLSLALTIPVVLLSPEVAGWFGYTFPIVPRDRVRPGDPRHGHLPLRRPGLPPRRRGELADRQPGMMTLISLAIVVAFVTSWAGTLGLLRGRDLVGARNAHHDHAARPLARDALDRSGAGRPFRPCRAAAGHGRAGDRRRHRGGAVSALAGRRRRPRPARRSSPSRRRWSSRGAPMSTSR